MLTKTFTNVIYRHDFLENMYLLVKLQVKITHSQKHYGLNNRKFTLPPPNNNIKERGPGPSRSLNFFF